MNEEAIKISYSRAHLQIICEVSRAQCVEMRSPPSSVMKRVRKKAEEEIFNGHAAFFLYHEKDLERTWAQLAVSDEEMEDKVSIVLANGAPHLKGVKIALTGEENKTVFADISFNTPGAMVAAWPFSYLVAAVDHFLFEAKDKRRANLALLHFVWLKACLGEVIVRFPLEALDETVDGKKDYAFFVDSVFRYICVRVYNPYVLINEPKRQLFYKSIKKTIAAASQKHGLKYHVVFEDFLRQLEGAARGPGRVGIGMPLSFLIAAPFEGTVPAYFKNRFINFTEDLSFQHVQKDSDQKVYLLFAINDDKMEAVIDGFDPNMYTRFAIGRNWIQHEMRKAGIVYGESDDIWKNVEAHILKQDNLNGVVVARGIFPIAPQEPFLQSSFEGSTEEVPNRNMRDSSRIYVRKGKLVAYVAYAKPGSAGKNVLGEETILDSTEPLAIEIGDGISTADSKKFYAIRDGIPEITDKKISLKARFVHEGDIDFKSGNVHYVGDVVIAGSVLPGSVLEVVGDVNITGGIFGASVYVKGNLVVDEGIRSLGYGRVSGKLTSKFIENSKIFCASDILVRENIINCELYAKTIHVTGGARCLIVGGNIMCEKEIVCNNLGLNGGSTTRIRLGNDLVNAFRLMQLEKRTIKLKKVLDQETANLRELQYRSESQLSTSQKQKRQSLTDRVGRLKDLLDRIDKKVTKLGTGRAYEEKAHIDVKEAFSPNCEIRVCDKALLVRDIKDKILNVTIRMKDNKAVVVPLAGA